MAAPAGRAFQPDLQTTGRVLRTMATAFDTAWRHYRAGQWPQAEHLCRQVIQADAGQAGAFHLLGLIAARTGRDDLALDCLHESVRLDPDLAEAHNLLGILL